MRGGTRLAAGGAVVLGVAVAAIAANQATISDVRVEPRVNRSRGTHYLSVKFVVNVDEYITSRKSLQINAACRAGDRRLRTDSFTGVSVRGLTRGTSKEGGAVLFMSDVVRQEIDACTLRFELHEMGRRYSDKPLNTFCYRGGKVSEGACE